MGEVAFVELAAMLLDPLQDFGPGFGVALEKIVAVRLARSASEILLIGHSISINRIPTLWSEHRPLLDRYYFSNGAQISQAKIGRGYAASSRLIAGP